MSRFLNLDTVGKPQFIAGTLLLRAGGVSRVVRGPADRGLGALMGAGLSSRDAVQAFHTIGGYIFGYVMMETGQLFGDETSPELPVEVGAELPSISLCAPFLHDCDFDEQFEFGLDLMLEGLRARIGA